MDAPRIDARALVEGAGLGEGCRVGPFAIVEPGAVLGARCEIEPFARVACGARLGEGVRVGQGAVVGGAPQHRAWNGSIPHCRIGDRVRLGEYATVHGSLEPENATVIEADAWVMTYAHVGHDARVGPGATLANGVQLAGHVRIEEGAFLGGGALVQQHVRVGAFAFAAGALRVERDLAPWSKGMGEPPRWAGLNPLALERAGWSREAVAEAESALRLLFRSGLRLAEAVEALRKRGGIRDRELADFAEGGRHGLLRP